MYIIYNYIIEFMNKISTKKIIFLYIIKNGFN